MKIREAQGRLGVLLPGMGAVATTFIAGTMLARRGGALPVGSLTQMGTIRLGAHEDARAIRDVVPLAGLDDLVFGGWDIHGVDAYSAALDANVLRREHLDAVRTELEAIRPMSGVFFPEYVRRLRAERAKTGGTKRDLAEALREDIRWFKKVNELDRAVAVWCGSTEVHQEVGHAHSSLRRFERAMLEDDPAISPSMLYAWACLMEGVPYANGAPNLSADVPALLELARERSVPVAGKDFKTGQTLMKTIIAPGLRKRSLGVHGWFSTNILGNRDGEVLDDPGSFRSKEVTKLGVLESILEPELHPELYGDLHHKVRIEYYRPRGDEKEGWDNIDIFGWLGYPMQLKIDFLCRDSILAAPLVLDLVLFLDLAQRSELRGIQEWLSFYFKSPMVTGARRAENDLFVQLTRLENELRRIRGVEPVQEVRLECCG